MISRRKEQNKFAESALVSDYIGLFICIELPVEIFVFIIKCLYFVNVKSNYFFLRDYGIWEKPSIHLCLVER